MVEYMIPYVHLSRLITKNKTKERWVGFYKKKKVKITKYNAGTHIHFKKAVNGCMLVNHAIPFNSAKLLYYSTCNSSNCTTGHWMIEEYVEGVDMITFINHNIDSNAIKVFLEQLQNLIIELHKHGVVHNDIKMENVIINAKKSKLWFIDNEYACCSYHNGDVIFGFTPRYAPPEIVFNTLLPDKVRKRVYGSYALDTWSFAYLVLSIYVTRNQVRMSEIIKDKGLIYMISDIEKPTHEDNKIMFEYLVKCDNHLIQKSISDIAAEESFKRKLRCFLHSDFNKRLLLTNRSKFKFYHNTLFQNFFNMLICCFQ